jgi:hypothetical protein
MFIKKQDVKETATTIVASSTSPNEYHYSNTGKQLMKDQVYVAAFEKAGDGYGSIVINREYKHVWMTFLKWCEEKHADDLAGKIDKTKRADRNSDDNTLSAQFCWPEEIAAAVIEAKEAGRVRILDGDDLVKVFDEIDVIDPKDLKNPVDAFVNKGPVSFAVAVKTYAMFTKNHKTTTSAGSSGGGGRKKLSGKEPWKNVQNPGDEGLETFQKRYAKISAMSDVEIEIGTCAADLKADLLVQGKPANGDKREVVKGKFLRYCQVSECKEIDDDEYRLIFTVDVPADAKEQWEMAQEILTAESEVEPAKTALQEYIDAFIAKDKEAQKLQAAMQAKIAKAEKSKSDFVKKFLPETVSDEELTAE